MSSDSSEDENLDLIREALDPQFVNNLFEAKKHKGVNGQAKQISKPSLRYQEEEENHMRVSSEFQHYVGRQLREFLDSHIKEVVVPQKVEKHERKNGIEGGIRLFGTSPNPVTCDESIEVVANPSKKRKKWKPGRNEENKISAEEQYKEAAVPAEWILSKDAVAGWEPSVKGKLEIYSAKDVVIKCEKNKNRLEDVQMETPEEKAERKKLKRKLCRERLKQKLKSEESENV